MATQVYFGNYNLQKGIFTTAIGDWRNSAPSLIQTLPVARGGGVSVVNTRFGPKNITVIGRLNQEDASSSSIEDLMKQFDKIFNEEESRYLRSVPDFVEAVPTNSVTDWTGSDDAASVAVNTGEFQSGSSSVGFDIDVSASGNDYATLTYSSSTQADLSSYTDTGNFELTLNIPDVYYIDSIDFRIGNDSSNYYGYTFSGNYEGRNLENGYNLLSVAWSDTTETGTVNDAQIDYCYIRINYSSSAIDIDDCFVDTIQWVNEYTVRNYPVFRDGEVRRNNFHYNIEFTKFEVDFLNHKGYAISTHSTDLFDSQNITTTSDTQVLDLDGSTTLLPEFNVTVQDATGLGGLLITNLNSGNTITPSISSVSDSDSFTIGGLDYNNLQNGAQIDFSGRFLTWKPGTQRVQLGLTSTSPTSLNYTTNDTQVSGADLDYGLAGNSFQATATGSITSIQLYLAKGGPSSWPISISVYADNSGVPDTASAALGTSSNTNTISDTTLQWYTFSFAGVSVTNTTTYWIVFQQRFTALGNVIKNAWGGDSALGYANGQIKFDNGTDAWTSTVNNNQDSNFKITIDPTPAWDVDWTASYRKLYS